MVVEVGQPVLVDKSDKASLIEVPIKKNNSVPRETTRSGCVVKPPIRFITTDSCKVCLKLSKAKASYY